ncbi:MAG: hypothetical protein J7L90_00395 [Dehalococcoidia bacterium]|nr:hypothetical protein [Dehalococcoidia bacterium]
MKHGPCTAFPRGKIDYKQLRRINPEAARKAVQEYLKTNICGKTIMIIDNQHRHALLLGEVFP